MFTVGVSDHVMVAHSIADPAFGPAQRLHGATYCVELQLLVPALNRHNVVMDIGRLRSILRDVLDEFDYSNLDDHPAFVGVVSTTERVAERIANRVADQLARLGANDRPCPGGQLHVNLRESPVAYAAYEREL